MIGSTICCSVCPIWCSVRIRMRLGADIVLELILNLTYDFSKKWSDLLFDAVSAQFDAVSKLGYV